MELKFDYKADRLIDYPGVDSDTWLTSFQDDGEMH